jgi:hypothetical protein
MLKENYYCHLLHSTGRDSSDYLKTGAQSRGPGFHLSEDFGLASH